MKQWCPLVVFLYSSSFDINWFGIEVAKSIFFLLVRSGGEIDWDIIIGQFIMLETNLKIKHSPLTVQKRASHLPVSPRTMHVTQNSDHYTVFLPRPNWRAPLLHHCFWFMRHEQRVSENLKNYSRDWNIYTLGSSAFVATLKLVMKWSGTSAPKYTVNFKSLFSHHVLCNAMHT